MRNVFGWSIVLGGCLVGIAFSQSAQRDEQPGAQPRPGGAVAQPGRGELPARGTERDATGTSDQQIAACIYIGCRNHMAFAEFAQDRLQNPEAKQFAEKMLADHTPGCNKMRELAGSLAAGRTWEASEGPATGRTPGAAPGRPGTRTDEGAGDRPGAGADDRPGARPAADRAGSAPAADTPAEARREERQERREERRDTVRDTARKGVEVEVQPGGRPGVAVRAGGAADGQLNWVSIHKEIADKCLSTLKKEFEGIEGADADKAYMAHEVMVHLKTIDELSILKNHASPTLRSEIDKSLQMAQMHLREAKQIKEQLKGNEREPRLSRPPGRTTTPGTPATPPRAVPKQDE